MKKLFTLLFITCALFSFSQSKLTDLGKVSKSKLAEAKTIGDIIKDYPRDTKSFVVEITGMAGGAALSHASKGSELTKEQKQLLTVVDKDSKLYIEITPDGNRSKSRSYLIHPN
jgi:hypothetical protein